MHHGEERPIRISSRDEVDGLVGDDVGNVTLLDMGTLRVDEDGIEVLSLSRQDVPVVEASRFVSLASAEVPLADLSRLVAA